MNTGGMASSCHDSLLQLPSFMIGTKSTAGSAIEVTERDLKYNTNQFYMTQQGNLGC